MKPGRVFILESPNPRDLLENRGERLALEQVCKLMGHDAVTFLLRDKSEFFQTCDYVGSIHGDAGDSTPLFVHISAHGNSSGIGFGKDTVKWKELSSRVQQMYNNLKYYPGHVILTLSACGANKQRLTTELGSQLAATAEGYVPPEFVFVFAQDAVEWKDAVVTWTIFYREITKARFDKKGTIQRLLQRLFASGFGHLKYYRWDAYRNTYRKYDPKGNRVPGRTV